MKIGDLIDGKYEILAQLGVGGMGEVYKARHTYLGTIRVIKVIRPNLSQHVDVHERFLREAQLATRVHHENVATLHDFAALPDKSHYTVWEYIDGENLAQRLLEKGPLPLELALPIAIQTLRGLHAIHRAGIIHRDISPENLMLTREGGGVKIIDLGVAKSDDPDIKTTQAGIFLGKLRYASPEQLGFLDAGQRIDGRTDIYALAIVLYEMLTGGPPFEATSPHQYLLHHSGLTAPPPIDVARVPGGERLQDLLGRALAREREKRPATAFEFAAALEEIEPLLAGTTAAAVSSPLQTLPATPLTPPQGRVTLPAIPAAITQPLAVLTTQSSQETQRLVVERATASGPDTVARRVPGRGPWRMLAMASIGLIAMIVIIAVAVLLIMRPKSILPVLTTVTRTSPRPVSPRPSSVPAASEISVPASAPMATNSTAPAVSVPQPANAVTASVSPHPAVPPPAAAETQTRPTSKTRQNLPAEPPRAVPRAPELVGGRTFVDGGDRDANDAVLIDARKSLAGTTHIAIRGEASPLLEELKKQAAGFVTVSDNADVVVRFNGSLERFRFGRKRRTASATIIKNGRVVLRYELPGQIYRMGDTPAEAFSRVLRGVVQP